LKKFGPVPSLENGAIILTYNPNKSKGEDLIKIKFFGKELNGGKINSNKKEPGKIIDPGNKKGSDEKSDDKKGKGGDRGKPGKKIDSNDEESDSSVEIRKGKGVDKGKGKIIDPGNKKGSDEKSDDKKGKGGDQGKPGKKIDSNDEESDSSVEIRKGKGVDKGKGDETDVRMEDIIVESGITFRKEIGKWDGLWKRFEYKIEKNYFITYYGSKTDSFSLNNFGPVRRRIEQEEEVIFTYNAKGKDHEIQFKFFGYGDENSGEDYLSD